MQIIRPLRSTRTAAATVAVTLVAGAGSAAVVAVLMAVSAASLTAGVDRHQQAAPAAVRLVLGNGREPCAHQGRVSARLCAAGPVEGAA